MRLNKTFLVAIAAAGLFVGATGIAQTAKPPGDAKSGGATAGTGGTSGTGSAAPAGGSSAAAKPGTASSGAAKPTGAAGTTATSGAGTTPTTGSSAPATSAPTGAAPTGTGTTGTGTTGAATGTGATGTGTTGAGTTGTGAGAAGTGAAAAGGTLDGSTYVVRLRDLETRIDELKEQIRRSHTRLSLLSDTILSGGVGGARAEISFRNDLSSAFRLTGAVFVLDGVVQYNKQDDSEAGLLASQKEIPIFSGSIPPGDHTLQVVVRLRGYGYGVFSYLRGYKFEVKSSHSFTVTEGKTISLETIAWEKGDVTTPLEQRPTVRYLENVRTGLTEGAAPPSSSRPSGGAPAASGSTSTTTTPSGGSASGNFSVGTGAK